MEEEGIEFYDTELEEINEEDLEILQNDKKKKISEQKKNLKQKDNLENKENKKILNDEFLIHIFKTFIIGGKYNQYDNYIKNYMDITKLIYKSTVEFFN